ncbi:MAG: hypothetical protein CMJ80_04730 [Planctomycetaceae bacterium]|nr:hypothetical protein [Planctomycetaceae bacterium]
MRIVPKILLFGILCGALCRPVLAQTWSQRLGFPADKRVLILSVRELGISWEMNEAAKDLMASGHATSASIVVPGPWFDDIARWSEQHQEKDFGVGIALINPYRAINWRLFSSEVQHTTLVDADGQPWRSVVQLVVSATADDVKREIDMQIHRAREAGVKLSHISGFHGTVFARPDIAAAYLGASRKYWLPAAVIELSRERIERFRREGFPIDPHLQQLVHSYPLPKLDDILLMPDGPTYDEKRDAYVAMLKNMPPGLVQIISRPAVETRGLQILVPDWQQRAWDAAVLQDPEVVKTMNDEGILVTDWRDIMHRFEARPIDVHEDPPSLEFEDADAAAAE